jgi:hypothetical protein
MNTYATISGAGAHDGILFANLISGVQEAARETDKTSKDVTKVPLAFLRYREGKYNAHQVEEAREQEKRSKQNPTRPTCSKRGYGRVTD